MEKPTHAVIPLRDIPVIRRNELQDGFTASVYRTPEEHGLHEIIIDPHASRNMLLIGAESILPGKWHRIPSRISAFISSQHDELIEAYRKVATDGKNSVKNLIASNPAFDKPFFQKDLIFFQKSLKRITDEDTHAIPFPQQSHGTEDGTTDYVFLGDGMMFAVEHAMNGSIPPELFASTSGHEFSYTLRKFVQEQRRERSPEERVYARPEADTTHRIYARTRSLAGKLLEAGIAAHTDEDSHEASERHETAHFLQNIAGDHLYAKTKHDYETYRRLVKRGQIDTDNSLENITVVSRSVEEADAILQGMLTSLPLYGPTHERVQAYGTNPVTLIRLELMGRLLGTVDGMQQKDNSFYTQLEDIYYVLQGKQNFEQKRRALADEYFLANLIILHMDKIFADPKNPDITNITKGSISDLEDSTLDRIETCVRDPEGFMRTYITPERLEALHGLVFTKQLELAQALTENKKSA